jgi:predicted nucleotidyltransferase
LTQRYQVKRLALLDPSACKDHKPHAPVNVLVEFSAKPTIKSYRGLQLHLEDLLQLRITLVTPEVLSARKPTPETGYEFAELL